MSELYSHVNFANKKHCCSKLFKPSQVSDFFSILDFLITRNISFMLKL